MDDFPEDYFWAVGAKSPTLLHHIMFAIEPNMRKASVQPAANAA
jgi:hypothetical protein